MSVGCGEIGFDSFNSELGCGFACGMCAARENGYACSRIFHVEDELVGRIRRVEWRGDCARAGHGKECRHEFVAVDEDDRHRDARFDTVSSQDVCESCNLGI